MQQRNERLKELYSQQKPNIIEKVVYKVKKVPVEIVKPPSVSVACQAQIEDKVIPKKKVYHIVVLNNNIVK